jgi:hypothetical protein
LVAYFGGWAIACVGKTIGTPVARAADRIIEEEADQALRPLIRRVRERVEAWIERQFGGP